MILTELNCHLSAPVDRTTIRTRIIIIFKWNLYIAITIEVDLFVNKNLVYENR